ncbi:phosphoadenylyl-sulfate reductase [Catenovulum maritimum]|uniref:Phosphoadenosine 5'-phosphosulfate reductase n=1 Tax=Catenovulum maritimum TaxID=1513271 RepID=A0A0J8GSM9_9ALTE|nr:phosphoadenylyl-sulfate reductase [Catenovulum maritimum]KMT65800.1 phosphoadenosine phosphosulfate reductase [Catenovulum maritimum]
MVESSTQLIDFKALLQADTETQQAKLAEVNAELEKMTAQQRVAWACKNLPAKQILSSSFGIQAAVMLGLVTTEQPEIPVVLTDTGYLFPETYEFIDQLTERLNLNLKIYSSPYSAAWQEQRFGKLWEQGVEGIEKYNKINKVEPMKRALEEQQAEVWYTGLRRDQSGSRANLPVLQISAGRYKFYPIIDWTNKDVHYYLKDNNLPYHPLWDMGYVSVGDWHTSRPLELGMTEEETRFFGLKRECGLHEGGSGI